MKKLKLKLSPIDKLVATNLLYLLCILITTVFTLSCAKQVKLPDISTIDTNEYIKQILHDQSAIRTLKGLAVVRIHTPETKISYRQATIAQSPNLLRLEAYSVLGRTEAVIISDGSRVGLKFAGREWIFYGIDEFDISLFYKVIPLKIDTGQLTDFLLGKMPENVFMEEYSVSADEEKGLLVFTSTSGDNILYVNHYLKIVKAKIRLENGEILNVHYNDFKTIYPGVYFPTMLKLEYSDQSIYVKYDDDIDINLEINKSKYIISQ